MERNFLLLILLLFSPLVSGEQFVFSARISTDNHLLRTQEFSISPLMVPLHVKGESLCTLTVKREKDESTKAYLFRNENELFECFLKENVHVYDDVFQSRYLAQTTTHIKVLPVRFTVEFKDEFANISLLSSDN